MADTTEPPAPADPPVPPPESNPPGWLISPYRMAPAIEGEAVALADVEAGQQDAPTLYAFDPTKPTIDQTRSAAITSIRDNFAALAPTAGADLTQYLKKTGDTALDLRIASPTGLTYLRLESIAGQNAQVLWRQGGVTRFIMDLNASADWLGTYTCDNAGNTSSLALQLGRTTQQNLTGHNWVFSGALGTRQNLYTIDIYRPYYAGILIHESTTNAVARIVSTTDVYYDHYLGLASGDVNTASPGPNIHFRQQVANGSTQERLTFDKNGGINVAYGAIGSNFNNLSAVMTNWTPDFRLYQGYGVLAGSSIAGFTFASLGQVARIMVVSPGAITLPTGSQYRMPQGGAVYGALYTMISIIYINSGAILFNFVPYD